MNDHFYSMIELHLRCACLDFSCRCHVPACFQSDRPGGGGGRDGSAASLHVPGVSHAGQQ